MAAERLRVIVVDDERLARRALRTLLAAEPDVEVVGEASRVDEAEALIRRERPGIVFLDAQLLGEARFDGLARDAGPFHTVFVTAFDEHALQMLDAHALDFLLKPVHPARLAETLARARRPATPATARGRARPSHPRDIAFARAAGDYAELYTTAGRRAQALAQQARLRRLRYQLDPHFLFNALNSIGALANEAPNRVQRTIGELSGFLRYSLLESERLEVPLRDELRAVTHYLELEKVRFEDDLETRVELEPAAAERTLPGFLVFPLVENAIKHGRRTSTMPLRVEVAGRIDNGALRIDVKNTGKWVTASQPAGHSCGVDTGLQQVREHLRAQYPGRHAFDVRENDGWVHARIRIDDDR